VSTFVPRSSWDTLITLKSPCVGRSGPRPTAHLRQASAEIERGRSHPVEARDALLPPESFGFSLERSLEFIRSVAWTLADSNPNATKLRSCMQGLAREGPVGLGGSDRSGRPKDQRRWKHDASLADAKAIR
jgi:hypothetical protein